MPRRRQGSSSTPATDATDFFFKVAQAALAQGFLPDVISTDIGTKTLYGAFVFSLPFVQMARITGLLKVSPNRTESMIVGGHAGFLANCGAAKVYPSAAEAGIIRYHFSRLILHKLLDGSG
jgi:hypothetical protein